jgi:hypothetical protein
MAGPPRRLNEAGSPAQVVRDARQVLGPADLRLVKDYPWAGGAGPLPG